MNWTLTPDQFALAWSRTDGDRIPYPLAVRLSARDTTERAAQLPALHEWCDQVLDAELAAALRALADPAVRVEVYGERRAGDPAVPARQAPQEALPGTVGPPVPDAGPGEFEGESVRPIRILGAISGNIAVVAAQRPGAVPDHGGDIRLFVTTPKSLASRVVSMLPKESPGALARLTAPLAKVTEDSRDMVTMQVAGPTTPARIRKLLNHPRDGIGQIVVSLRRPGGDLRPFGVLCWIDVRADGRYTVRTGADVDVTPVDAEGFRDALRPMLTAAEKKTTAYAQTW
ncbi:ESX secretion-associated protein EspG [Nocardia sp. NPDC051832]|uniref:ESX secretion-associated protein EspG n=1 Tax=Nocardia sp. NPDC051832 TaxID=3155673 RepID=UPI003420764C